MCCLGQVKAMRTHLQALLRKGGNDDRLIAALQVQYSRADMPLMDSWKRPHAAASAFGEHVPSDNVIFCSVHLNIVACTRPHYGICGLHALL